MTNREKIINNNNKLDQCLDIVNQMPNVSGGESEFDSIIERTISDTYVNDRILQIGSYFFYGCQNLNSISCANVTSIGSYCVANSGITQVNLPRLTTINNSGFQNSKITYIEIPLVKRLADSCFRQSLIETLTVPNVETVNGSVFRDCSKLESVVFLNTANITLSGTNTFYNCTALRTVDFYGKVTISSGQCFQKSNLTSLILRNTSEPSSLTITTAFAETPVINGTGYIYVPSTLVDQYKSATNWSAYASQIRAIEDYPEITGD